MEIKGKKFKFKKVNTLTDFERKKLYKENQMDERKIKQSEKYFTKAKQMKLLPLRNIISPLTKKEITQPKKAKNMSMILLQRKQKKFDTSKAVYYNKIPNFLTTKSKDFKNPLNSNIIRGNNKIYKLAHNEGYKTSNQKIDSKKRKNLWNNQYNNGFGYDKHIITSKSMPDIFYETKYTTDNNNIMKTKDINMKEEQKNQTHFLSSINNISNKLKEKISIQSIISTLGQSKLRKIRKNLSKKYKYCREKILRNFSDLNRYSFKSLDRNYLMQRKKYNFIKNTHLIDIDNYEELQREVKRINKNSLSLLLKENNKLFSYVGSIVDSSKIPEKFRDPLNNSFDRELKEERKRKEKNNIKLNIISGVDLMKDIDEEIEKRKIIKKVIKGKSLMFKVKRLIIRKMTYLKHIQISLQEILNDYKMSKTAFSYPQTEHLIMAIRNKKFDICCDILDRYKYIVLDFDYFHLTPLHWAAKFNFYEIIPKLIAYGAPVNEQNIWGNTPLHISVTKNYYETSIFLLLYLASPFIKNRNKKKPFDCTNNIQFNMISKKIINIHLRNIISRQRNYYESVQKEFSNFVVFEFSNLLNPVALSLIKGLKSNYL